LEVLWWKSKASVQGDIAKDGFLVLGGYGGHFCIELCDSEAEKSVCMRGLIVEGVVKVPVANSPLVPGCLLEQLGPFCHEGLGLASVARVTLGGQVVLLGRDPGLVKISIGQGFGAKCRLVVEEAFIGCCQGVQVVGNGWVRKGKEGKEDLSEPRVSVVGVEGSQK
jgi:hypothetical protein